MGIGVTLAIFQLFGISDLVKDKLKRSVIFSGILKKASLSFSDDKLLTQDALLILILLHNFVTSSIFVVISSSTRLVFVPLKTHVSLFPRARFGPILMKKSFIKSVALSFPLV